MMLTHTLHAQIRKQQRAIPAICEKLLDEYGAEEYDHHGAIKVYFNKKSIKKMEREFGAKFVREIKKYLNVYMVKSVSEGKIITIGWVH